MADDRSTSISNQEVFDRYVMKVKSNVEAARRFMNDEGIVDEPIGLDRWVYRFRRLSSRWAKLSKRQKSESTKKAFMEFQQERFLKPDVTDSSYLKDQASCLLSASPSISATIHIHTYSSYTTKYKCQAHHKSTCMHHMKSAEPCSYLMTTKACNVPSI